MKFLYEYRTSDNVRHEGVISAPNREVAFSLLRERGIRPGRMVDAPGFLNKVFGKGKRWIAIAVLSVVAGALFWIARSTEKDLRQASEVVEDTDRRQVIGDAVVIEMGIKTGWAEVFPEEGERFLASFAIPGVPAGLRNTKEGEVVAALSRKVGFCDGDGIEARQIKSMVEGMKAELRRFLAKGGTVVEYGQRLVQRQELELSYYNRSKSEIEAAAKSGMREKDLYDLWLDRNGKLRKMGIKLVAFPE